MHTQDYEKVWDRYSDRFEKNADKHNAKHLGDEWGPDDLPRANFEEFVVPYIGNVNIIGELGVGGGKYTIIAAQYAQKIFGIDISDKMLVRTSERLKESKCEFVPIKCKNSKILLEDATLDLFFSFDSMVHIFPYDFFSYVGEISRVLKNGSIAVLEFADWDTPGAIKKFKMDYDHYMEKQSLSPGAFGFISRNAIRSFAISAGMEIVNIQKRSPRTSVVTMRK